VAATITAADQTDSNTENNAAASSVTPVLANVKLSTAVSSKKLIVGGTVVFTLTVKNTGPGAASNVAVSETLGPGLSYIRFQTPTRGSFNPRTKTWTIAKLPANASASLKIFAQVKKTGVLESSAALTATGIEVETSQVESTGTVTGTKSNGPATWSYVALGGKSAALPIPKPKKSAPKVTATPSPLLQAMQMANANILALQALLMRLGM
jgi:uncharacterized repeat protein (TIGR01451 family)